MSTPFKLVEVMAGSQKLPLELKTLPKLKKINSQKFWAGLSVSYFHLK